MTRAQSKALREIKAILKPLSHDEKVTLIREVEWKLTIEEMAEKLLHLLATLPPRKRK